MLSIDILLAFWTLLIIVLLGIAAFTADGASERGRGVAYRLVQREPTGRHSTPRQASRP